MSPFFLRLATGLLALLVVCSALAADCVSPQTLRFAVIPKDGSETLLAQYEPLIRHLEATLGRKVEMISSLSYSAVIQGLATNHVDIAELGPASYATAIRQGVAITAFASLLPVREAREPTMAGNYHSVLLSRASGPIRTLESARNTSVGLTDPLSTSGAILPQHAVRKLTGVSLEKHFSRVTYTGSHARALEALRKGWVDTVFVSSSLLERAIAQKRLDGKDIRILWRSAPIPRSPFVLRTALCPDLQDGIRQSFFEPAAAMRPMFQLMKVEGFAPTSHERYEDILRLID